MIEHVSDPAGFVRGLARVLADGGLLILSTPNRTPLSRLAMITIAEGTGRIPRGTHDWHDFVTPDEITELLNHAGLEVVEMRGVAFSPAKGLHLSPDMALNFILSARRR